MSRKLFWFIKIRIILYKAIEELERDIIEYIDEDRRANLKE